MAKKTTEKKASESAPKKVAAKKAPAKKAAAKKAPVKKAAAKKAAPKKAAAKKASAKSTKQNIHSTAIDITPDRVLPHSLFTDFDIQLFQSGKHYRLYNHFGAHELEIAGVYGTYFAVWAPNAQQVSVLGNFNHWNADDAYLLPRWDGSGIWEGFVPSCQNGEVYKYCIIAPNGDRLEKADPFARFAELRPKTASISWNGNYPWSDQQWMKSRAHHNELSAPYSVYEVHLGSWMRDPENPEAFMSYDALAEKLVAYVKDMNFTHVELMPIMEHPFDGSWGYQVCGYFAPSSRFGSPEGFAHLVDELHNAGIGVILDWVPAHFPGDAHGLYMFDGTHLYEHADPRKGFHPDWKSYIFNLGRNEVRAFMLSSAMYWLDRYHIDGLRVDAVASMLYLDYSRNAGEWIPNEFGGRENLENVSFLKELNEAVYKEYPDVQTIAEESTSWPGVSRPTYTGGLGFGMKWMMGWMNDSLRYFERDPFYRQYHQNEITFSLVYAFTENFMLPFSHDEVVHGKKSMVYKMPGDDWQRMANLRLLYLWMYTHPGSKLLFMGCEFAQTTEWNHQQSLDWHLLNFEPHQGMQKLVRDLNGLYKQHPALYQKQFEAAGFEWIDASDSANSVLIFMRKGNDPNDDLVIAMNMTPVPRHAYRIGLPHAGTWKEALNTDADKYYGSSVTNGPIESHEIAWQGRAFSAEVDLPPLGGMVLMREESGL